MLLTDVLPRRGSGTFQMVQPPIWLILTLLFLLLMSIHVPLIEPSRPTVEDIAPLDVETGPLGPFALEQERLEMRDAHSRHFDLGNGRTVAEISLAPRFYQNDRAEWHEIDPTFQATASGWEALHNALGVALEQTDPTVTIFDPVEGRLGRWSPFQPGSSASLVEPGALLPGSGAESMMSRSNRWLDSTTAEMIKVDQQIFSRPGSLTQETVIQDRHSISPDGEWIVLKSDLNFDRSVRFEIAGDAIALPIDTAEPIDVIGETGALLFTIDPPTVTDSKSNSVEGRLRLETAESGIVLSALIPAGWWTHSATAFPVTTAATMHVLSNGLDSSQFVAYSSEFDDGESSLHLADNLTARPVEIRTGQMCAGYGTNAASGDKSEMRNHATYFKYALPMLPDGMSPTAAYLVGVPTAKTFPLTEDNNWDQNPPAGSTTPIQVSLTEATADWSTVANGDLPWSYPAYDHNARLTQTVQVPKEGISEAVYPVSTWDVTGFVQGWYADYNADQQFDNYHGFRLYPVQWSVFNFWSYQHWPSPADPPGRVCYPKQSTWESAPAPGDSQADGQGLILYIQYEAPDLQAEQIKVNLNVPTASPTNGYLHQHHEYDLPDVESNWQLVAAHGARPSQGDPNVPIYLRDSDRNELEASLMGNAHPSNSQGFEHALNFLVINGNHVSETGLKLWVQEDSDPGVNANDKQYHLQTTVPAPAPILNPAGQSTTIDLMLGDVLIAGQEFNFVKDRTIEILVPYADLGITEAQAHDYGFRLYPDNTLTDNPEGGIPLMPTDSGYELEMVVNEANAGNWLLVYHSNIGFVPVMAGIKVTTCENSNEVVRYPLNGKCVELRRPVFSNASHRIIGGELQVYNPAGFDNPSPNVFVSRETTLDGTPVMPLLGQVGDNDHWVALKGGTYTIDQNAGTITTSADARLVLADFSGQAIESLPVIMGRFEIGFGASILEPVPNSTLRFLLENPMSLDSAHSINSWDFTVDLDRDRFVGTGPFQPEIEPTSGEPTTIFTFDAEWSISAVGGSSLDGELLNSQANATDFAVGSLNVSPTDAQYSIEFNGDDINPLVPWVMPKFQQVRLTDAELFQAERMGGARLPVNAVIFINDGRPIEGWEDGTFGTLNAKCGDYCFDLRADEDSMGEDGVTINREYRMPDIVIQDSANTVQLNLPSGVEFYSADHPMSQQVGMDDLNFSYGAFNASVKTFEGKCPLARDPLNPTNTISDTQPDVTIIEGKASMSMPNLDSDSADLEGGQKIEIFFTLCDGSLREMGFEFSTGANSAIPIGTSGLHMHLIGGVISLTPQMPGQQAYTTVTLEVQFRGMTATESTSSVFVRGRVVIDSRGLFDVQLNSAIRVFANAGLAVDGHFWVAWSPLDLGFEVSACMPFSGGYPQSNWEGQSQLCQGNELLFGSLRMHVWQGQGWQNQYHWLPDNDDLHTAARFQVSINIKAGMIVDSGLMKLPPSDTQLVEIQLAFGEFCSNETCTEYEWGVMGAIGILGFDVGMYYGFDSGLSFILGSADFILIDEFGQNGQAAPNNREIFSLMAAMTEQTTTVEIHPHSGQAMFGLNTAGTAALELELTDPQGRVIDIKTNASDVEVDIGSTYDDKNNFIGDYAIIVVKDPMPGTWRVRMKVDNQIADVEPDYLFYHAANRKAPTVEFDPIPTSVQADQQLPISWKSDVTDDLDMRISIYYETVVDGYSEDVTSIGPVIEHLPLSRLGSTSWDLTGIPTGEYRLFARLENSAAQVINSCGEGYEYVPDPFAECTTLNATGVALTGDEIEVQPGMTIVNNSAPAAPVIENAYADGVSHVVVTWDPNAEPDLGGYIVTCVQPEVTRRVRVSAKIEFGSPLVESGQVIGLDTGVQATCRVQAYDTSFNISPSSAVQLATPTEAVPQPPSQVGLINSSVPDNQNGGIALSWPAVEGANSYLVNVTQTESPSAEGNRAGMPFLMASTATTPSSQIIDVGNVTEYTLSNLAPDSTYEIWVVAVDGDGRKGEKSDPIQVITPDGPTSYSVLLPLITR